MGGLQKLFGCQAEGMVNLSLCLPYASPNLLLLRRQVPFTPVIGSLDRPYTDAIALLLTSFNFLNDNLKGIHKVGLHRDADPFPRTQTILIQNVLDAMRDFSLSFAVLRKFPINLQIKTGIAEGPG